MMIQSKFLREKEILFWLKEAIFNYVKTTANNHKLILNIFRFYKFYYLIIDHDTVKIS